MSKLTKSVLVVALLILLTGCWDQIEIEDRGFVVGTALDTAENGQITLTFQIVLPTQMKGGSGQKSEGGNPYINLSSTASSVFKAARNMSNEMSRSPYLSHNKIIIISDELASTEHIGDVLDLFVRDPESRRASHIMLSKGEARSILDIYTGIETLPVQYISSTQENPDKSESITPPTNIGELHDMLLSKTSFALPRIVNIGNNRISTAGAAVFNGDGHKLIGYLNEEETTGRNMILGTVKTASLELEVNDEVVVLEVRELYRKIKVRTDEQGLPVFDLTFAVNGAIGESHRKDVNLLGQLNGETKQKGEEKIKQLVMQVIEKSQKEYKSDFMRFGDKVYEQKYEVWEKYRDDWDRGANIYSTSKFNVTVDVSIKTIGTVTKSK